MRVRKAPRPKPAPPIASRLNAPCWLAPGVWRGPPGAPARRGRLAPAQAQETLELVCRDAGGGPPSDLPSTPHIFALYLTRKREHLNRMPTVSFWVTSAPDQASSRTALF